MLTLITTLEPGEMTNKPTTQRMNYPFNSFLKKGKECYGFSSTGIYKLGGDKDNTDPIDAHFEPGASYLGLDDESYLRYVYVYGELEGDMHVTAIPDDKEAFEQIQLLETPDPVGLHKVKVKMGEGDSGYYWKLRFTNIDGAYFAIKRVLVLPTSTNHGFTKY